MWRNADVLDFVGWLRDVQRRAARERAGRLLRPRPLQPARVDGGGAAPTSTRSIPTRPPRARARYALLRPLRRRDAGATATRPRSASDQSVRARGRSRSWSTCSSRRAEYVARDGRVAPRRVLLRRAERAAGAATPRSTTARCSAGRSILEPARPPHGRDARRARSRTSVTGRSARAIVVWAHNSHLGDARATEMGERGELNVGQLVRADARRATRRWSASPPTRAPSPRRRTGTGRPSASASGRRCRAATRRSSTTPASRGSCCDLRGDSDTRGRPRRSRGSSGRSA